jgi:hypothetical protein
MNAYFLAHIFSMHTLFVPGSRNYVRKTTETDRQEEKIKEKEKKCERKWKRRK